MDPIGGNVETRLRKIVEQDEADGTIWQLRTCQLGFKSFLLKFGFIYRCKKWYRQPGRGRLPFSPDMRTKNFYSFGNPDTQRAVITERKILDGQGGGCQVALGVCMHNQKLYFDGLLGVLSIVKI